MSALFASGRIVDVIVGLILVEAAALWIIGSRRRQPVLARIAPTLLSGACLLAALRGALVQAWWGWIAAALFLGLLAHIGDLARRLARRDTGF